MSEGSEDVTVVPPHLLAHALANISEGSLITDAAQHILYANAAFCELSGYAENEIVGRNCRFLQSEASDPRTITTIRHALSTGETFRGTILNYSKDGRAFWNALTIEAIRDGNGAISHYASVQRNVTDLIELQAQANALLHREREQRETTQSLLRVARSVNDLSTVEGVSQAISDAAKELCATDRSAVVLWDDQAQSLSTAAQSGWTGDLASRVLAFGLPADGLPEIDEFVRSRKPELVEASGNAVMDIVLRENDLDAFVYMPVAARGKFLGIVLVGWSTGTRPPEADRSLMGRLIGLAGIAALALDNARLLSNARWSGAHDPLTGLPNRAVLELAAGESLDAVRATSEQVAVLHCDIDRFKLTNDGLGHSAGDTVLVQVAEVLQASVRAGDIVARVGGNEFVVVLARVADIQDAHDVANRVRAALAGPFEVEASNVYVDLSIGISISDQRHTVSSTGNSAQLLIRAAEADMYREKSRKSGSSDSSPKADGLRLDTDLRGAVDRGEIEAVYPPQIDLATDEVVAVEALARWNHPELGLIHPGRFIRIAEDNGVIKVAVNVSVIQLMTGGFADQVADVLDRHEIPADALTIEVPESRLIVDVPGVARELTRLQDMGTGVSIDDFGTGQASLAQLFDLPVTELKIDKSFIRKGTRKGEAFITAMVGLSRELDLRVVAEGVSTEQDIQLVRDLGCDRAQGYGIATPIAEHRLAHWRTTRASEAGGNGETG